MTLESAANKPALSWDMREIKPAEVLAACVGFHTQSCTAAPSEPQRPSQVSLFISIFIRLDTHVTDQVVDHLCASYRSNAIAARVYSSAIQ